MADFLDEVFSEEPPVTEPEPITEPGPVVEEVAQPEIVQEAPLVSAVEPVKEDRSIPLATALNWRDEAKEYKQRIAELEQQRQPSNRPDPFDDPEGYEAYLGSTLATALTEQRFNMSAVMAKSTHGEDTVTAASTWAAERAQNDPGFRVQWQQTLQTDPHPMEWVVRQHKRDALLSAIGDVPSVDDWFTQEAAKRGYAPLSAPLAVAQAAVQQAPRPAAPPRSIASEAPASAPATATDAKAEFEAIFNGR